MSRRFEAAYAAAVFKGILNRTVWDQVLADVDARVADLENIRPDLESAVADLTGVALGRINEVLTPAIASILEIVERGFLVASSNTTLTLSPTTGNIYTFVVPAGPERDLFTPSPFVTVSRRSDYHDYAVVRTIEYDKVHGEYVCEILETSTGSALGPFNDWVLSSGSGISQAVETMMGRAKSARDEAETFKGSAERNAESTSSDRIQTGLDRIATGNDRAATLILRNQAVEAVGTVDTTNFLQLDGLRQLAGKLRLAASTAGRAALNMPAGTDPSAPADGDAWNAGGTLKAFLGGVTRVFAFLGLAQTWTARQTFAVPLNLTPGGTAAAPLDGDLRATGTALVVRIAGTDQPVALAADVAAKPDLALVHAMTLAR